MNRYINDMERIHLVVYLTNFGNHKTICTPSFLPQNKSPFAQYTGRNITDGKNA